MCEDDPMTEGTEEGYHDFYYEGMVDSVTDERLGSRPEDGSSR